MERTLRKGRTGFKRHKNALREMRGDFCRNILLEAALVESLDVLGTVL